MQTGSSCLRQQNKKLLKITGSYECKVKLSLCQAVEGHKVCELSRLPHFLDNWFTVGGEVIILMRRPHFIPRKIPGTHLC
jgi:hypothetical protein